MRFECIFDKVYRIVSIWLGTFDYIFNEAVRIESQAFPFMTADPAIKRTAV